MNEIILTASVIVIAVCQIVRTVELLRHRKPVAAVVGRGTVPVAVSQPVKPPARRYGPPAPTMGGCPGSRMG